MAEWLVEEGIAEHRAVRLEGGRIARARIDWPGELTAGSIVEAVLAARRSGSPRGTARTAGGEEVLVNGLPRAASEGAKLRIEVTRAAIGERGRFKRAQGRPSERDVRHLSLAERLRAEGHEVRLIARIPECDWDELLSEALTQEVAFAGGSLLFATTSALTTIDVDGNLEPRALALAAVPAIADALARFDLGGSIAIDFPTLSHKADRRALDTAIAEALMDWPHERTAANGFGLVQLVARQTGPSLLHRAANARTGLLARQLLRRAEGVAGPGALLLTAHPAITAKLTEGWLGELARRTGREVRTSGDPALALEGGFAQAVPL